MILPRPRGIIRLAASRPTTKALVRLASMTLRHSSVASSTMGLRSWMPALLTRMSISMPSRVEPLEGCHDGGFVGDVEASLVDRVPGSLHLGRGRGQASLVGAVEHDRCAGGGEPLGHRPSEAAGGAGDEGGAALKRKQVG